MKTISVVGACFIAFSPVAAQAFECPAGKEGPTPFKPETETKGELDVKFNGQIELGEEEVSDEGWHLRSRTITFGKGAVAQLHSHDKRPEIATMMKGTVTIYALDCTVGYKLKEGEIYRSGHGDRHWAVNETDEPAVMFAVDVVSVDTFPVSGDHKNKM